MRRLVMAVIFAGLYANGLLHTSYKERKFSGLIPMMTFLSELLVIPYIDRKGFS